MRTPSARSALTAASPIACAGNRVTYQLSTPNCARLTATLASPPPNVATNWDVCRKRSKPGGLSRSMISPNVTTLGIVIRSSAV